MAEVGDQAELCLPISTLGELLAWKPVEFSWLNRIIDRAQTTSHKIRGYGYNCHKNVNNCSPLPRMFGRSTPKTLFCHDMKGGYLDDRFPGGVENSEIYTFFHWSAIDTFVYFSHQLVTIPTLSWLNAAHRHGCKVLGTFITEFGSGEIIWKAMSENKETLLAVVDKLVAICKHYRFDGYLLNIENPIPPDTSDMLVEFVRSLKEKLFENGLHDAEVIWYDSVIYPEGKLKWQNKLNDANRKFFDVCDGIFLNYTWKTDDLELSATNAGTRILDVYVGVDVFGRGCFGGGGFNTRKAVELVREYGMSLALFAPGWTHEVCPKEMNYLLREFRFWNFLWQDLYVHGPATLPFSTSFCIGKGIKKFSDGEIVGDNEWGCVAEQEYQMSTCYCLDDPTDPSHAFGQPIIPETGCVRVFEGDAFRGGNCLILSKMLNWNSLNNSYRRLFTCEFMYPGHITISCSLKSEDLTSALALVMVVEDSTPGYRHVFLFSELGHRLLQENFPPSEVEGIFNNPKNEILKAKTTKSENNSWITYDFVYNANGKTILEISCIHIGLNPILFGNISVKAS